MIYTTIHESDLVRLKACSDGMAFYREMRAMQGGVWVVCRRKDGTRVARLRVDRVKVRLGLLGQMWLARDCVWADWLRDKGLLPAVSAPEANLYGANLQGANLRGANLRGANLYGADLYGADLQGAYLCGAYLRGAYLRGAYLRRANLYGANLRGADLYGADLQGADLYGAYRLANDAAIPGWVCSNGVLIKASP
jgi:hypothetical protein